MQLKLATIKIGGFDM